MNRALTRVLALGMLTATMPLHAAEGPGIALPPVPRELLITAHDTAMPIRHVSADVSDGAAADDGDASATGLALGPRTIRISPGTTAIVEVAIDHLNRTVTPFASPRVPSITPRAWRWSPSRGRRNCRRWRSRSPSWRPVPCGGPGEAGAGPRGRENGEIRSRGCSLVAQRKRLSRKST